MWLGRLVGRPVQFCWFRRVTGLPCPTCGTTRGVLALLHGRPLEGWLCNPLVFTLLGAGAALLAVRLTTGRALGIRLSRGQRTWAWAIAAAAVLANWVYLIVYVG